MQTIGIIGGMSWESTRTYYELINVRVRRHLGGLHSAKIILVSVDFAEVADMQARGDWRSAAKLMVECAQRLQSSGADFFLIATNTMHKLADEITASVGIPMLHIADAAGQVMIQDQRQCVALLGTRFTMEDTFYVERLKRRFGLEVLIPPAPDRNVVHNIIYNELCLGEIRPASRDSYRAIIERLAERGAECVVLGCTEIALLIGADDVELPVYDTTEIHCQAAVERALLA